MKTRFIRVTRLALFALFLSCTTSRARGEVLLLVDVSNPNAVTVTATGGQSAITTTSSVSLRPIHLKNFFASWTGRGNGFVTAISTLQGPRGDTLNTIRGGDSNAGITTGILRFDNGFPETFTAGQVAFTGSGTWNFASVGGALQANGFSGDITTDDAGTNVVGTYSVISAVPEPSTLATITVGLVSLTVGGYVRRRRRG